jgi:hypothetical protein
MEVEIKIRLLTASAHRALLQHLEGKCGRAHGCSIGDPLRAWIHGYYCTILQDTLCQTYGIGTAGWSRKRIQWQSNHYLDGMDNCVCVPGTRLIRALTQALVLCMRVAVKRDLPCVFVSRRKRESIRIVDKLGIG